MRINELMTKTVKTIGPHASLKQVAGVLVENGISGLPVCDAGGRVLGVVSEADILLKERGVERRGGRLARLIAPADADALAKAEARTAADAMTSPAITISPFRSVQEAARLMLENRINRLPVVNQDRLVGIVTRADLVRAFQRPDDEIALEIRQDVLKRAVWLDPGQVSVAVSAGEVILRGEVSERSEATLMERLVARVPGVVGVTSEVSWRVDDTSAKFQHELARTQR